MTTVLGLLLVLLTLVVGIAISVKANQGVRSFDHDKHESFIGSNRQQ